MDPRIHPERGMQTEFACLAQLVEYSAHYRLVKGSSPTIVYADWGHCGWPAR